MTEVNPAGWLQNAGTTHTAEQLRSYMTGLFSVPDGAASLRAASGVHPALGAQLAVVQNGTPNMSVNVGSGLAFVHGSEGSKQGTYFCQNDGTVNKTLSAADPTNPRIDIVVAKVQDSFYSGVTNAWSLAVVTGTPAGSPSAPAAPNNSIILAQIAVAANATSITNANITDKRTYNSALGGVVVCTSSTRPSVPYEGLYGFETDTNKPLYYDGANWRQHFGLNIVTSSTRPASPYTGMRIYETDTSLWYTYNGTKWLRDRYEIIMTTNETRTSTTTQSALNSTNTTPNGGFSFAGEANAKYSFRIRHLINTPVSIGLAFNTTFPAGAQLDLGYQGVNSAGSQINAAISNWTSGASPIVFGYNGGSGMSVVEGTIQFGGTPGNFVCQYAQGVSSASAVTLLVGSSFEYRQVG